MDILTETEVPGDVRAALRAAGYTKQRFAEEARRHFAGVLYAQHALTLEQAARLANMSQWDFLPFLAERGVSAIDYADEELEAELETVEWLTNQQPK